VQSNDDVEHFEGEDEPEISKDDVNKHQKEIDHQNQLS
jgi:hypothetical protein